MSREAVKSAIGVAPIVYIPNFITNPDDVFEALWDNLDWVHRTPRRREYWTNILNKDYTYGNEISGGSYVAQPSNATVDHVAALLSPVVGFDYEGCFLNGYSESRSGLEWHADISPDIDHTRPIAVVSVGGPRAIQFMKKDEHHSEKTELILESGSLLLMNAGMQDTHLHRIPKAGYEVNPRISLTYRSLKR